jgi:putative addiction module component (TIGR02574 family)
MQPASDAILDAALKLPEDERLLLASRLLETVPDEPGGLSLDDPNLAEELKRRSADREGTVPWSEVRDEL